MLNAHEDLETYERKQFSMPPYIQRSVSAPAIAEHVSEAILPAYQYEDEQDGVNPSRLNPRMANSKKGENNADEYAELFEDNQGGDANKSSLLSLINDTINRTPMDLIQADFPSTPSSVYSKRIFDPDHKEGEQLKVPSLSDSTSSTASQAARINLPTTGNNLAMLNNSASSAANSTDSNLEQATKSLDKLYVSPVPDLSPKSLSSTQSSAPLLSQYNNAAPAGSILSSVQAADPLLAFNGANQAKPFQPKGNAHQNNYNTLLGNNPSAILNNGLNPLAPAVAMGGMLNIPMNPGNVNVHAQHGQHAGQSILQQGGVPQLSQQNLQHPQQQQQQQAPQPAYFVQQAVYLDQNGQPIFYRPVGNQYGQDFMYAQAGGADGSHLTGIPQGLSGDLQQQQQQMQQANFMQFPGAVPALNQQGMPTGYWTANPNDQGGMGMYMAPGQQGMPGMQVQMNGMDTNRRMVFNPATGQYNSIPVIGNQGGRGGLGNQQGNSNLGGGYGNMMNNGMNLGGQGGNLNMPALLPRNNMGGMQGNMMDSDNGMFGNRDDDRGNYMDYGRDRDRRDRDRDYGRNDRDMRGRDRNDRDRNDRSGRGGSNNNASGVNPVRDSLVDEFRGTYGKSKQWGLRDLLGHVVAFCQDQHGSRFIQQRLEVCSDVDKQLIFDEIIPSAPALMTDVFGNYVLQKLFEYGTPDQCESLAILLKGQSVQLAMQMYGCRVVQKALEYVGTPRLIELVQEFESPPQLLRCVHDSNGNHVIQKCIEIVSKVAKEAPTPEQAEYLSGRIQFIINAFQGKVKELSSHPYGCRVVQRILEHCSNNQKAVILEELRQCCTELVQDCYGNYVIQFVMQHGWEADRAVLIREVQSNLLDFSQHKFASNVVEKCLQFASKKDRDEMIWTIINVTFDLKSPVDAKGHCVLESMVRDPYANYVVQKVIDVSDERQRAAIMRYVKENITQLRRYTYGKHIIVRLEKITNEKF